LIRHRCWYGICRCRRKSWRLHFLKRTIKCTYSKWRQSNCLRK
jgi:hypothetical protein